MKPKKKDLSSFASRCDPHGRDIRPSRCRHLGQPAGNTQLLD